MRKITDVLWLAVFWLACVFSASAETCITCQAAPANQLVEGYGWYEGAAQPYNLLTIVAPGDIATPVSFVAVGLDETQPYTLRCSWRRGTEENFSQPVNYVPPLPALGAPPQPTIGNCTP